MYVKNKENKVIFLEEKAEEKEFDRMYEFLYCPNIGYKFIMSAEVFENDQISLESLSNS